MAATAGEANAGQFSSSRPTCVTSSLPTLRDYAGVHRVDAVCTACNHWAQLDLTALVASGHAMYRWSTYRCAAPPAVPLATR
jgi:hypothetical protein